MQNYLNIINFIDSHIFALILCLFCAVFIFCLFKVYSFYKKPKERAIVTLSISEKVPKLSPNILQITIKNIGKTSIILDNNINICADIPSFLHFIQRFKIYKLNKKTKRDYIEFNHKEPIQNSIIEVNQSKIYDFELTDDLKQFFKTYKKTFIKTKNARKLYIKNQNILLLSNNN